MRTNLIKPKNISEAKSKTSNDGMLDMVIAFDTTGSMAGCIRSVKEYVTELVPKLFAVNPNLRLGVVAFGDYCDMESQHEFGKAYQVLDLTCDEQLYSSILRVERLQILVMSMSITCLILQTNMRKK